VRFGRLLGAFWVRFEQFGRVLGVLGAFWAPFGRVLALRAFEGITIRSILVCDGYQRLENEEFILKGRVVDRKVDSVFQSLIPFSNR
jgi:hypothetical protein